MNEQEQAKYFDEILAVLKKGNYHSRTEALSKKLGIELSKCNSLCRILEERNILKLTTISQGNPRRYSIWLNEQFQIIEDKHFTKLYNKREAKEEQEPITKILFLAANPLDSTRLRVEQEFRDVEEGLKRAQKREKFELKLKLATRPRDLSRAILDENPQILHFSGHGGTSGIALEDENGNTKIVSNQALSILFGLFEDTIKCVFLNSCHSESQATEISTYIPHVIGMNKDVPDNTAISFATSFYDAIGAGKDIEFAFNFAVSNISLEGLTGKDIPVLIKKN